MLDFTGPLAKQLEKSESEIEDQVLKLYRCYTSEWRQTDMAGLLDAVDMTSNEAQGDFLPEPVQGVFFDETECSRIY